MTCRQVRRQLDLYELGELGADMARQVRKHLEACAGCRAELERIRALGNAFGSLPEAGPRKDLWPGVKARLRPRRSGAPWFREAWQPAITVMAALVLAFVLFNGALAPRIAPADLSFGIAEQPAQTSEEYVALGWTTPFADEAALGVKLASLDVGGEGG